MRYPQGRIMVFCKAPEAGKVKTRLAASVGEQVAATVHEYLAWHCLQMVVRANLAPVELWCAPAVDHPFFHRCERELGIALRAQVSGDLGDRMLHAFADVLPNNPYAVVIGTDCPALNSRYLEDSLAALESGADAVVGPAEDGGYVLLGLSRLQEQLFKNMAWGTSNVLTETLSRMEGSVKQMPLMWDVDHVEDLIRMRNETDTLQMASPFVDYLDTINIAL